MGLEILVSSLIYSPTSTLRIEDVVPPRAIPEVESNNKWMACIDIKWEVCKLQLEVDFVPTYQPITTTWLILGPSTIMEATKDPLDIGEGSTPL